MWASASFARGFCALTDDAEVQYKCTGIYNSKAESAIRWNDPALGIEWPIRDVIVSEKDRNAPALAEWLASPNARHFTYPFPSRGCLIEKREKNEGAKMRLLVAGGAGYVDRR